MDLLGYAVVWGVAFAVIVVIGAWLVAQWRGFPAGPLPLYEMLRRQSPRAAGIALASGRDFELAVRQCISCGARAQCRAWLDSGKREGFEEFCANAGYLSRMRSIAE